MRGGAYLPLRKRHGSGSAVSHRTSAVPAHEMDPLEYIEGRSMTISATKSGFQAWPNVSSGASTISVFGHSWSSKDIKTNAHVASMAVDFASYQCIGRISAHILRSLALTTTLSTGEMSQRRLHEIFHGKSAPTENRALKESPAVSNGGSVFLDSAAYFSTVFPVSKFQRRNELKSIESNQ